MRLTKGDKERAIEYDKTQPKQFGNMHERMQYLVAIAMKEQGHISDNLWSAIWDLQTEVQYHKPENPPYGRRHG